MQFEDQREALANLPAPVTAISSSPQVIHVPLPPDLVTQVRTPEGAAQFDEAFSRIFQQGMRERLTRLGLEDLATPVKETAMWMGCTGFEPSHVVLDEYCGLVFGFDLAAPAPAPSKPTSHQHAKPSPLLLGLVARLHGSGAHT